MVFYRIRHILIGHWFRRCYALPTNLALLTLVLLFTLQATGQSYVSASAGAAVPLGNYASRDYPEGGFALPGATFSVEGAWFFDEIMGVGGEAGGFLNPVEVVDLAREKMQNDPFLLQLGIRSDPYQVYYVAPAFFYQVPISSNFSATFIAKAGLTYSISPYQLHKPEYYLFGDQWFEITSAKSWSWMTGFEGKVNWNFSPCIGLTAGLGANYAPVEWRFRMTDGNYRYQSHEVIMIHVDLGVRIMIGSSKED